MELIIGKKFKFEVWEAIVKKMSLNEVAKFRVNKSVRFLHHMRKRTKFVRKSKRCMEKFRLVSAGGTVSVHFKNIARHRQA